MSLIRRTVLFTALVACALLGSVVASEARPHRGGPVVVGVYADPFWYGVGYAAQWGPYGGPYGYPPYPPYGAYRRADASLRLDVEPKAAEVYLDGYYAGIVDDFDGVFQRLHAAPGEHELSLYLDGYRGVTQHVYLAADATFKVKYQMEHLAPGEAAPPRPTPREEIAGGPGGPEGAPVPRGGRVPPGAGGPRDPGDRRPPNAPPAPPRDGAGTARGQQSGNGTIEIRVRPTDADILVDGQPWRIPEGQDHITIDTSAGPHTVQVRKAGYIGYLTEVQVAGGDTATVNVNLRSQP